MAPLTMTHDETSGRCGQIRGRLDAHAAPGIRAEIAAAFFGSGRNDIVLDLSDVSFLDSIGLGALIGLFKDARRAGGSFHISGASERVLRLLQLTDLDTVFTPITTPSVS